MDKIIYDNYLNILREELVPAMGCTEPIAVAYAAAVARQHLGALPTRVEIRASGNIIKNVKSVFVPGTGGMRGLFAAAAAGIVAGNSNRELEVISNVTPTQIEDMKTYLAATSFKLSKTDGGHILDLIITVFCEDDSALVRITGCHTNIVRIEKNGEIILDKCADEGGLDTACARKTLSIKGIIDFADCMDTSLLSALLDKQIDCNMAIACRGLEKDFGASIGKILLKCYGEDIHNKAKAYAAAGSDARMNGCELPVVINSGSGNQGITASVPVIIFARDKGASTELLYRALAVSNLVTIHLKLGIGKLSAYCGVISAGCGAAAGIAYLSGGRYDLISRTIVNGLAINSGIICDGAKPSCAAKIASAVDGGLLGMNMAFCGSGFLGGDGIVAKDVENTINNVCILAKEGMRATDLEIIKIMIEDK